MAIAYRLEAPEINGRPFSRRPTPLSLSEVGVSKDAMEAFLVFLSGLTNPDTGRIYTSVGLAQVFGESGDKRFRYSPRTIERKLREHGVYHQPVPKVRQEELPENERSFFLGLALGDFQMGEAHWGGREFVTVETESTKAYRRGLLRQTIGTWGEVHSKALSLKIYLESPTFDFVREPIVSADFLDAKSRYAPFLLGLLTARLSERENRLSLNNGDLLERIHRRFSRFFDFSLGRFETEHKANRSGGKTDVSVITVKHPGEVIAALISVPSVLKLPFLPALARLEAA